MGVYYIKRKASELGNETGRLRLDIGAAFRRQHRIVASLLGTGCLAIGVTGIVSTHGGNTNLIHACVTNSNGGVRIVGPTDVCKANETAYHWPMASNVEGAPLALYDVNNQQVGLVRSLEYYGPPVVTFRSAQVIVQIAAFRNGFSNDAWGVQLGFTSSIAQEPRAGL